MRLLLGDCIEQMKELPANSIDTVITDPPYGLEFMGKDWDYFSTGGTLQGWTTQWATEALRVAKPGATLMCFGGTRTWHRIACGIEDAGWKIFDTMMWLYGSGFPKAQDIGKMIDKKLGNKREVIGINPNHRNRNNPMRDMLTLKNPEVTKGKTEWEGYKTHALKPAWEPIILAKKPNDGTYVDNALKWGVAGLNIDGGRIPTNEIMKRGTTPDLRDVGHKSRESIGIDKLSFGQVSNAKRIEYVPSNKGRYPANLVLDEVSAEMLDEQSGTLTQGHWSKTKTKGFGEFGGGSSVYGGVGRKDKTKHGASRFFYVAKASKRERNEGLDGFEETIVDDGGNKPIDNPYLRGKTKRVNRHPTVKPIKLMEYLCTLTKTPTGGIVLDPFMGSGTTGIAAIKTGREFIGIEKEPQYFEIAEARITYYSKQKRLEEAQT